MKRLSSILPSICLLLAQSRQVSAQSSYSVSSFDAVKATGLTPACSAVYTSSIASCQPSDFVPTNPCSAVCIEALTSAQVQAQAACSTNTIPQTSLLGSFRNGQGVAQLCTLQKAGGAAAQTPLRPSGSTASPTSSASGSAETGYQEYVKGGDSMMALPKGTVIAIVVAVSIAIGVFAILAIFLFRRYYMK